MPVAFQGLVVESSDLAHLLETVFLDCFDPERELFRDVTRNLL